MKKLILSLLCLLMPLGHLAPMGVSAQGIKDLDGECLLGKLGIDIDIDFNFGNNEKPVFDGPGLKKGARIVKCKIDGGISREEDLRVLIIGWMRFLLSLTAVVAVVALVWAGFVYITAAGDDGRVGTAKNIVLYTVLGLILILASYAIVYTVMQARFGTAVTQEVTTTNTTTNDALPPNPALGAIEIDNDPPDPDGGGDDDGPSNPPPDKIDDGRPIDDRLQ